MKVIGGENIASSGEDRSKPFEFRLVGSDSSPVVVVAAVVVLCRV